MTISMCTSANESDPLSIRNFVKHPQMGRCHANLRIIRFAAKTQEKGKKRKSEVVNEWVGEQAEFKLKMPLTA